MNAKQKNLTAEEQNLIKDILRIIGNDGGLPSEFALCVEMEEHCFNKMCDSITKNITAAAAPDMALQIEALKASNAALLAALVSLEEQFRPVTDTDQYIAGIARAAIAKATPPAKH